MKKEFIFLLILIISLGHANEQYKIMTYNVLDLDEYATDRIQYFNEIFSYSDPDVIVVQEIIDQSGANLLLNTLQQIDSNYSAAQFINGWDTDNMLYYKSDAISLISQNNISTALRDISEYVLEIDGNYLYLYSCHLKASQGYEQERLAEIQILRSHIQSLPAGSEYLICGDMNLYTSSEPAYQELVATSPIIAEDLSNEVGNWHNSSYYSNVHTQSTRLDPLGSGSSGGMDDRFDFIFSSYGFNNGQNFEFAGNYTVLGNDGNHFNQSINYGTNSAVPSNIADALYYASDHLPVCIQIANITGSQPTGDLFISEYIEGSSHNKALEIYNPTQNTIFLDNYEIQIYFNGSSSSSVNLDLSGDISADDVFVIAHSSSDAQLQNISDLTSGQLNFNGNDAVALVKNSTIIDAVGEIGIDPGSGWEVAGISNATKDHTLVRKETISAGNLDWSSSAGTNSGDSEWIVHDQNEFSFLGNHSSFAPQITVLQPNGGESWERLESYQIQWQSQDFSDNVKIEILDTENSVRQTLVSNTENDGEWQWLIPYTFPRSENYRIIISAADDNEPSDESDGVFTVGGIYTIPEIQTTADSGFGNSPLLDEVVSVTGIVTGVASNSYFIQDGIGAWHGIYIYDSNTVTLGDSIVLTGTVYEYYDKTEIKSLTDFAIISSNNDLPNAAVISTNEVNDEKFEGVLVQIENAECTNDSLGYGEWEVNDGSGTCIIGDLIFSFLPTQNEFYNIHGIVDYSYDDYKIEPRNADDIVLAQLDAPQNISIEIADENITISWNAVADADSYKIYGDDEPNGNFSTLVAENITGNEWTTSVSNSKKFYRVVAVRE